MEQEQARTYLTAGEVARTLAVSESTVARWAAMGRLPSRRHPTSGHRLFPRATVEELRQQLAEVSA